jgi:DNA-binding SARP family transcriptional activator
VRFQLLGPLSITDGRSVVVLPPAKPTSLLAALLVRPGEVVPTEHLRQAIWGERQPATAKAALQSCVLRLRRLFAKYDIEEHAVVAVAGGYRLPADDDTLDLLHFRRLVSEASGGGDAELSLLRTALGLWQGPLLANVPSDLLHRDEVPRLVEERLRVLERVCDLQLARGRCREVLVDLWEATRTHPLHEGFSAQLMRALYGAGRQNEALAEYGRIRAHLRDELGVDPATALKNLELAILRGEELHGSAPSPAVHGGHGAAAGAAPHGDGPPSAGPALSTRPRLPQVPGFTGRSRETADLVNRLKGSGRSDGRADAGPVIAVISGGPGMGKTALALHAGRLVSDRYPDGGVLLPLTRPDGTPRPTEEAAAELLAVLPADTPRGSCLVVLDDVVHPDQVRDMLGMPGCGALVVTSRMRQAALVATHGPAVLQLGALTPQESTDLLTAVLGRERVAAEAAEADALAELCGHVPLALRIAAARLLTRPQLSLADYAAWLRRDLPTRLALPDDPRMSVPLTLDGALERLPGPLADAHLRLARLEGQLTAPDAATALRVPETHAEELLERLLDTGLLDEEQPGALRMNSLFRVHALHRAA